MRCGSFQPAGVFWPDTVQRFGGFPLRTHSRQADARCLPGGSGSSPWTFARSWRLPSLSPPPPQNLFWPRRVGDLQPSLARASASSGPGTWACASPALAPPSRRPHRAAGHALSLQPLFSPCNPFLTSAEKIGVLASKKPSTSPPSPPKSYNLRYTQRRDLRVKAGDTASQADPRPRTAPDPRGQPLPTSLSLWPKDKPAQGQHGARKLPLGH